MTDSITDHNSLSASRPLSAQCSVVKVFLFLIFMYVVVYTTNSPVVTCFAHCLLQVSLLVGNRLNQTHVLLCLTGFPSPGEPGGNRENHGRFAGTHCCLSLLVLVVFVCGFVAFHGKYPARFCSHLLRSLPVCMYLRCISFCRWGFQDRDVSPSRAGDSLGVSHFSIMVAP